VEVPHLRISYLGAGGYYVTKVMHTICFFVRAWGILRRWFDHLFGLPLIMRVPAHFRIHSDEITIAAERALSAPPFGSKVKFEFGPITKKAPIKHPNRAVAYLIGTYSADESRVVNSLKARDPLIHEAYPTHDMVKDAAEKGQSLACAYESEWERKSNSC
jgi:hypothetical protein